METTFLWSLNHHLWSEIIFFIVSVVWVHRYNILQQNTSLAERFCRFRHQIQADICYIHCLQIHFKDKGRLCWTLIEFKVCCPSCVCFLPLSYVCPLLSHNKTLLQIFRWLSADIYRSSTLFHIYEKRSNAHSLCTDIKVPQRFLQQCTRTHTHTLRKTHIFLCDETDRKVT